MERPTTKKGTIFSPMKIKTYRGIHTSPKRRIPTSPKRSVPIKYNVSLPPEILGEIMHRLPSSKDVYNLTLSHKNAYLGEKRTNILKKKYDEETNQAILEAVKEMYPRMTNKPIEKIPVKTILDIALLTENMRILKYAIDKGAKLNPSMYNQFMLSSEFIDQINNLM
jgi:hypothetical protein